MSLSVRSKLDSGPMFDMTIVAHGFAPYLRDYNILVDVSAPAPDHRRSYLESRYRYRFTHCVVAHVETAVSDEAWRISWDDLYVDYEVWEQAGAPEGYVWGVRGSLAYPGPTYVEDSKLAHEWSERLHQPMHEVLIETNGHNIRLIFNDVIIQKIAQGSPDTNELTAL